MASYRLVTRPECASAKAGAGHWISRGCRCLGGRGRGQHAGPRPGGLCLGERKQVARILVLTSFVADDKVFPAIKAGALGYILKDTGPDELVRAIRQVHRGQPTMEAEIARKVLFELAQPSRQPPTVDPLTARELEVLRLLAQGKSNREIAEDLVLSEMTVRTHVSNILGKLHLASRTQTALYALKEGLASLNDVPLPDEG